MTFNPWMLLVVAFVFALMFIIKLPYTTNETYWVPEQVNFMNTSLLQTNDGYALWGLWHTRTASFSVMNNDTVSGSVTAYFYYTEGMQTLSKSVTEDLNPGEVKIISVDIPTDSNATYVKYEPSTKQVQKTGEVTRQVSLFEFFTAGMGALK